MGERSWIRKQKKNFFNILGFPGSTPGSNRANFFNKEEPGRWPGFPCFSGMLQ